ncbi:phosphoribosyltransferase family protein [Raineya sp.]|jgi:pyrimidine operon attenuation protein/uracil phosphoribosyltransferase
MLTQILSAKQVHQKIRRLAYQIYENHFEETEIVLVGIENMGLHLAYLLHKEIQAVSPLKVRLCSLKLDKTAPLSQPIQISEDIANLAHKSIILIDDVLNSGKTMFYAFKPFFEIPIKSLQTLVLVNRDNKLFPINPDYVGYSLATTLQNHVSVVLDEESRLGVYLS